MYCFGLILDFHSQQLIPYVEEDSSKNEDHSGPTRFASEERREIAEVNKVGYYSTFYKVELLIPYTTSPNVTEKHNL